MPFDSEAMPTPASLGWLDPTILDTDHQSRLRSWLHVQVACGLRPETFAEPLRCLGSPERLLAEHALRLPGFSDSELAAQVETLRRHRVRFLPLLAPGYPERLAALSDPALVLALRGAGGPDLLERPMVAIVGARSATVYGRQAAYDLARQLVAAGLVVVSGLARGIDARAHEGALDAGGVTLAVQACGPDRIYPPEHRALEARIREAGFVLTEMPPGTPY